jgi:hypothetical protein
MVQGSTKIGGAAFVAAAQKPSQEGFLQRYQQNTLCSKVSKEIAVLVRTRRGQRV